MNRKSSGGWGSVLAVLIVIGLVIVAVMWSLSLVGHAVGLTPTYHDVMNRDKQWLHEHYPNVGWRYVLTASLLLVGAFGVHRAISWLNRSSLDRTPLTMRRVGTAVAIAFVALLGIRGTIGAPSTASLRASGDSNASALAEPVAQADEEPTDDQAAQLARERKAERRREAERRAERRRQAKRREARRRRAEAHARRERAAAAATATPEPTPAEDCDPNYSGCLDPNSADYDCEGGSGDGPDYTGTVTVLGDDHYDLNRDSDNVACDVS
jgi:hypothetical protein